jgi:hypothetical protein
MRGNWWRCLSVLCALTMLVLSDCVPPPTLPTLPRALPFLSPPPRTTRSYLPLVQRDSRDAPVSPKKGISLACGSANMAAELRALRVAWLWNWQTNPPLFAGVESVPAIWDASRIGKPLGGNSEWLLGFNEPDGSDQANMTPEAAAVAWRKIEQTYPDRKLASPQTLHPGDWLERWYAAYSEMYGQPPRMDAIALHTYYGGTAAAYIARVREFIALAQRWGVPEVWVTEWTLAPGLDRSLNATAAEMRAFVTWLEDEPMVTRYAPFSNRVECMGDAFGFTHDGPFDAPLYDVDGRLTHLGRIYGGLP